MVPAGYVLNEGRSLRFIWAAFLFRYLAWLSNQRTDVHLGRTQAAPWV